MKPKRTPAQSILVRIGIILLLLGLICVAFWLDRDGLKDERDGEISRTDVVYFTLVTVTTVGYGDIVPVTEQARLFDALLVTPMRAIIWVIFIGTAYQFVAQKYVEGHRMKKMQKKLKGHVIIAGYDLTGRAAAKELVAKNCPKEDIVVVDVDPDAAEEAASEGYIGISGDAEKEATLRSAKIDTAEHIIVSTGRDDTNVLICLTAKDLNPHINIVARASEEENVKLLKRSGADIIISPSVAGGTLIATSIERKYAAEVLQDIMTAQHGLDIVERETKPEEYGKKPKELKGIVVIGVVRDGKISKIKELDTVELKEDDVILYIEHGKEDL